jgi:O-antigen/teichoic acid export membrane protein
MSLNLANALQAVAIAWINTKAAPFGAMVARREFAELDRHFFAALKQSVGVCIAGAILVLGLVIWMSHLHFRLAQRLLDPLPLGILLLTIILNVSVFGEALYLRAHKQEKFLLNSVLAAVLMTASTFFLGRAYGAMGMVSGSLLIAVVVGLPLGTWTFVKYRREWHA